MLFDILFSIGNKIRCLDIGTGANAIYPLIGFSEYGWSFVGTDIKTTYFITYE